MGFFKKTIRDIELDGQTVLVRAGFDVPLTPDGKVNDDLRIRANLPTIEYLLDRGCKLVLIGHLGRPEGRDPHFSFEPVAKRLEELLGRDVIFIDDCVGDKVIQGVKNAPRKSVILLENLRFNPGEKADDAGFAKELAWCSQAAYFIQDSFNNVHRSDASMHAITDFLPSVAGLLVEREYTTMSRAMEKPTRPLVAVLGGAKVSDKIQVVERFAKLADTVLVGGAMANTFLRYKGVHVGASKVEQDQHATLENIYAAVQEKAGDNADNFLVLPEDVAVATEISTKAARLSKKVNDIDEHEIALDIGDATIERFCKVVEEAGTVVWSGPLGMAEFKNFAHGSARLALSLATHPEITSIVGGGDTADFVLKWDVKKGGSFSHVSTGGGASLDLMAGKKLPGVESLLDA